MDQARSAHANSAKSSASPAIAVAPDDPFIDRAQFMRQVCIKSRTTFNAKVADGSIPRPVVSPAGGKRLWLQSQATAYRAAMIQQTTERFEPEHLKKARAEAPA